MAVILDESPHLNTSCQFRSDNLEAVSLISRVPREFIAITARLPLVRDAREVARRRCGCEKGARVHDGRERRQATNARR